MAAEMRNIILSKHTVMRKIGTLAIFFLLAFTQCWVEAPERIFWEERENGISIFLLNDLEVVLEDLPVEALTEAESAGINHLWESEKLSKDILILYKEWWHEEIFEDLAAAERNHQAALGLLRQKYGLADDLDEGVEGVFSEPAFADCYQYCLEMNSCEKSILATLGSLEYSVYELDRTLPVFDNADAGLIGEHLRLGGANHLRAVYTTALERGLEYHPQFLELGVFLDIVQPPTGN